MGSSRSSRNSQSRGMPLIWPWASLSARPLERSSPRWVGDVIMPPIGLMLGGMDFSSLAIVLKEAVGEAPAVTLNYGKFIQTIIDFIIIAFCIFILVRGMNNLKRKEEAAPAEPPKQEVLLTEIRDLLKSKK